MKRHHLHASRSVGRRCRNAYALSSDARHSIDEGATDARRSDDHERYYSSVMELIELLVTRLV